MAMTQKTDGLSYHFSVFSLALYVVWFSAIFCGASYNDTTIRLSIASRPSLPRSFLFVLFRIAANVVDP